MSNLLINEPPLMVLPSLACKIGLNESIVLQQIHYWLNPRINKTIKEGHHWVYNSYDQWQEQFSFWSAITIKRTFQSLEKSGLLLSKNLNPSGFNKTKWYRIDYDKLKKLSTEEDSSIGSERSSRWDQIDPSMGSNCAEDRIKMIPSYIDTETTTEITTETSLLIPQLDESLEEKGGEEEKVNPIAEEMVRAWDLIVREGKGAPTFLRGIRPKNLQTVLKTYFEEDLKNWKSYCIKIASSKFLMGETKEKFQIKIDWAITPTTIEKILEGSITTGDRLPCPRMTESQEDPFAQAKVLYSNLSTEEMEAYKQLYVLMKRMKDPGFNLDDIDSLSSLKNSFKHFVVMEIVKSLSDQKS